ncbi:MAG: MFS transporter [Propionibacteriaceae bacterium]|nr:MFS transporter [Propionibacteriaceae bacterium]
MANLGFYVASIGVVVVLLAPDLGLQVEQVAWLGSVFGYGLIAMAIAGPYLLRLGANRVLALAAASLGLGSLLLAFPAGAAVAYAGAVLQGLGAAGVVLVAPKFLHGPGAEARLTRVNAAASVAGVAAPLLLGVAAITGLGGRLPLLLIAACMVLLVVAALRSGPEQQPGESSPEGGPQRVSRGLVLRRWLALVCAVSVEFSFVVWGVVRLTQTGLDAGSAAVVGASFPIGMALGRVVGSRMIARLPMVAVGSGLMLAGTLLVVLTESWPLVGAGQLLAGFGVATLYPITLARLMGSPGLKPELGASLGVLASGTAITVAPTVLALLATVVDLRLAFLVPVPLLLALLFLHNGRRPLAS